MFQQYFLVCHQNILSQILSIIKVKIVNNVFVCRRAVNWVPLNFNYCLPNYLDNQFTQSKKVQPSFVDAFYRALSIVEKTSPYIINKQCKENLIFMIGNGWKKNYMPHTTLILWQGFFFTIKNAFCAKWKYFFLHYLA